MKNRILHTIRYITLDVAASSLTWFLFFIFRKKVIESRYFGMPIPVEFDTNFYLGFIFLPVFWVMMGWMSGYYRDIYRKSRLKELGQTFVTALVGAIILFFLFFLDDIILSYRTHYLTLLVYFTAQFLFMWLFRLVLTTYTKKQFIRGRIWFNTLIVGSNKSALDLYKMLSEKKVGAGNKVLGFVYSGIHDDHLLAEQLPNLGPVNKIKAICLKERVEEVIIAAESSEHYFLQKLITDLDEKNVKIRVVPDMYDIISGSVRSNSIFGEPLIEVSAVKMPPWQRSVKRMIDVLASACMLLLLLPLFILIAVLIRLDSSGPVFYSHFRVGQYGRPFRIYKFRSMVQDAEKHGPALSSDFDRRITRVGKWMRKLRIDEFPQFYNVLIGDMSLVGPRPEREYFINQIVQVAPHYKLLQRVKPGITSWGQVKFGYAENVDQMVERLKFDILYMENMSLALDFKILIYTILTILRAEGK